MLNLSREEYLSKLNIIANTIQAKKYGYESNLVIDGDIVFLAEQIFKNESLAFFESQDVDKFYELDDALGAYLSSTTKDYFKKRQIDDEIRLTQLAYRVDSSFFSNNSVVYEIIDPTRLSYVKGKSFDAHLFGKLKLPMEQLIEYSITSKYIDRVDSDKMEGLSIFFLTNEVEYFSKRKIYLSIITKIPGKRNYEFTLGFFFDYEKFHDIKSSPVRLFLKLIDLYGVSFTIYDTTKKFWFYEELSNYKGKFHNEQLRYNRKIVPLISMCLFHGQFADKIAFLYGIDPVRYINDLNSGKI